MTVPPKDGLASFIRKKREEDCFAINFSGINRLRERQKNRIGLVYQ
jgi:hypothetical protein